jgi:hypothetical protein
VLPKSICCDACFIIGRTVASACYFSANVERLLTFNINLSGIINNEEQFAYLGQQSCLLWKLAIF